MRLKYESRFLLVHSVIDDDERHRWLVLMCEEIVEK